LQSVREDAQFSVFIDAFELDSSCECQDLELLQLLSANAQQAKEQAQVNFLYAEHDPSSLQYFS
jgi:hypothetical protein